MKKEDTSIKISKKIRSLLAKWKYELDARDYNEVIERILKQVNPIDIRIVEGKKGTIKDIKI